jgi:hypothetical protein
VLFRSARKLASMEAELNAWKEKGLPTDFAPGWARIQVTGM